MTLQDGRVAVIVRDNDAAARVIADGRFLAVYTLAEVAAVIDALPPALPILFVPELFARATGMRATSQVASALAEELS